MKDQHRDISVELKGEQFENVETERIHTSYRQEKAVLECIKAGDIHLLERTYRSLPTIKYGRMTDSSDPLKELFYGSIANTTLVTRYAIEGGMDEEAAFSLSDIYIKKMEKCRSLQQLELLNEEMALDFTSQVSNAKKRLMSHYSTPVLKAMRYLADHTHEAVRLSDLAAVTGLSEKYLSALFRKETGQTFTSYFLNLKIEEAKYLLIYTDDSNSQISEYLAFHSQSYFIQMFRKKTSMTPGKYRSQHGIIQLS